MITTRSHRRPGWIRLPGEGPLWVRLAGEDYEFAPPPPLVLLDIAADNAWGELLPGALVEDDFERVLERLLDPEDEMDLRLLVYACQMLGQHLYGWPMFAARRICWQLRYGEPVFRAWCASKGMRMEAQTPAADWCAAGVAWMLAGADSEVERTQIMAKLQVPTVLDVNGPGITPAWSTAE